MEVKSIDLSWIVVKDLKQAIQFYTEVVGLKLMELNEEYGWAELQGHQGGSRLGIAKSHEMNKIEAGQNACVTFSVENLEKAKAKLLSHATRSIGEIQEVPGHVKLQMMQDRDGNYFQLVETLTSFP